eukprot:scpid92648/ scgid10222/ 
MALISGHQFLLGSVLSVWAIVLLLSSVPTSEAAQQLRCRSNKELLCSANQVYKCNKNLVPIRKAKSCQLPCYFLGHKYDDTDNVFCVQRFNIRNSCPDAWIAANTQQCVCVQCQNGRLKAKHV